MIVLSLDIASSTGFALLEDEKLLQYGLISYKIPSQNYPWGILHAAQENAAIIFKKVLLFPEAQKIIIERTNNGRARNSQHFLEYTHAFLLQKLEEANMADKIVYTDTGKWRKAVDLKLSKEDKVHNKNRRAKKKTDPSMPRGIITKKHLSVRMANKIFGLSLIQKDDDISDALLLGLSYFK